MDWELILLILIFIAVTAWGARLKIQDELDREPQEKLTIVFKVKPKKGKDHKQDNS